MTRAATARDAFTLPDWSAGGRARRRQALALALVVHLVLAAVLLRRSQEWIGSTPQASPPLSVVFLRPVPAVVARPPAPPAPEPPVAVPDSSTVGPTDAAGVFRPRPADLVFVIDEPEYAEPGTPRVAGTAGVSLPEVAAESLEEALRIGRTPRSGWVVLRVLVLQDGSVSDVTVDQAGDVEAAARMASAVKALRFRPALERGHPVDAWYTMVWPPPQ